MPKGKQAPPRPTQSCCRCATADKETINLRRKDICHSRRHLCPHSSEELSADGSVQVDGLWAAVHLLVGGRAVAVGLVGSAVEELAPVAGGQDVALVGEGVAPLRAELVWAGMLAFG